MDRRGRVLTPASSPGPFLTPLFALGVGAGGSHLISRAAFLRASPHSVWDRPQVKLRPTEETDGRNGNCSSPLSVVSFAAHFLRPLVAIFLHLLFARRRPSVRQFGPSTRPSKTNAPSHFPSFVSSGDLGRPKKGQQTVHRCNGPFPSSLLLPSLRSFSSGPPNEFSFLGPTRLGC